MILVQLLTETGYGYHFILNKTQSVTWLNIIIVFYCNLPIRCTLHNRSAAHLIVRWSPQLFTEWKGHDFNRATAIFLTTCNKFSNLFTKSSLDRSKTVHFQSETTIGKLRICPISITSRYQIISRLLSCTAPLFGKLWSIRFNLSWVRLKGSDFFVTLCFPSEIYFQNNGSCV